MEIILLYNGQELRSQVNMKAFDNMSTDDDRFTQDNTLKRLN